MGIIGAFLVAHECVSWLCCSTAHTEYDSEKNTSSNDGKSSKVQQGDHHNVHIRLPKGVFLLVKVSCNIRHCSFFICNTICIIFLHQPSMCIYTYIYIYIYNNNRY